MNILVHGNWSAWSEWSACSLTCGMGRQSRGRLCNNPPPQNGGDTCFGNTTDLRQCKMGECCKWHY